MGCGWCRWTGALMANSRRGRALARPPSPLRASPHRDICSSQASPGGFCTDSPHDAAFCCYTRTALALSVGTRNRRQGCSIALRGAQEGCVRTTCAPPDRAAQARARPRPRCRLDLSRHRLGRVLLTITLAPQASAAAAPQGCSRRRLPPTLAPRASCAAGSRGCSRPTAALTVGLRRGHALLGSPRVAAPRASAAAAAQGCSRRRLPLPLASCAADTRA